jgi:hypothetical protein
MTSKSLLLAAALTLSLGSFAQAGQSTSVPANIKQALTLKYPAAANISWEMEQGYYVPSFKNSNVATKALIDAKGSVIQTETKLAVSALPASAKEYISNHYSGIETKEAATVTTSAGKTRIKAIVGLKVLVFEPNGTFINESPTPIIY